MQPASRAAATLGMDATAASAACGSSPAVRRRSKRNVNRSGTRKEELLLKPEILQKVWVLRKVLYPMDDLEATEFLVDKVRATKNNAEFFDSMRRG